MNKKYSIDDMVRLLNKIGKLKIGYSGFTKKHYAEMDELNGILNYRWRAVRSSLTLFHHETTPEKAIESFFYDLIDSDEILVGGDSLNRYTTEKNLRIYRFEDDDFKDITKDVIKTKEDASGKYFQLLPKI